MAIHSPVDILRFKIQPSPRHYTFRFSESWWLYGIEYINAKFVQLRYHNLAFNMLISCSVSLRQFLQQADYQVQQRYYFGTLFVLLTLAVDIVGWSTSSLRRRNELPKVRIKQSKNEYVIALNWVGFPNHLTYFWLQNQKFPRNNRYPHVINEEPARTDHLCKADHTDDMEGLILFCYELITIVLALKKPHQGYINYLINHDFKLFV